MPCVIGFTIKEDIIILHIHGHSMLEIDKEWLRRLQSRS